ncbi:UDP-N-acetyl-D-glucosamine 6-dehydrogenase [bacterium BMS3Abin15]|nr:UDP-N-acetyl-D-glucosamine 6-dehydrogenase [bacterium BMS3Abin15]
MENKSTRIAVIGGSGHVGLPLSLVFSKKGFPVTLIDSDAAKIEMLKKGELPFLEEGGTELLKEVKDKITYSTEHSKLSESDVVILTVGTPVDEHLNPRITPVFQVIDQIKPYLRNDQVIVLRSTLFPGLSEKIYSSLQTNGLNVGVSFCPERIAQGKGLVELPNIPQIISASDERTLKIVHSLFSAITPHIIELSMTEAELAKLFSNAWRYIKFAVANQFYMVAVERGLDFYKIREAMMFNYERASDFPMAGFAAGPCLFKDTMQLASFNRQNFALGHASMLINETLPDFLVHQVKIAHSLEGKKIGILGMAFKANNDDMRESLAYKLRKLLQYEGANVICSDPYIEDPAFAKIETVLSLCEMIFIGCPHSEYRDLKFTGQKVIDCWGLYS